MVFGLRCTAACDDYPGAHRFRGYVSIVAVVSVSSSVCFHCFTRREHLLVVDIISSLLTIYFLIAGGSSPTPATLIDRLRDTFKLAEQHGLSFEKAFNLLDRDGSGGITVPELHAALQVRCRKPAKYFAAALSVVSTSASYN
jgi:hypothetical protein